MKVALTIDELYGKVRDYDIVLTNDAALATALNAKIDTCRIDGFAYTPKQVASMSETAVLGRGALSDLESIEAVRKETGYSIRFIYSEIQNIRDIRKYTSDVEKFLYTKKSKEVYAVYKTLSTVDWIMGNYDPNGSDVFFSGKKVAVIGIEMFNDLDKHFVPTEFDEIDLFKDGTYDIDTIYSIGNDRQIADCVVDLITPDMCLDTAIILDSGGRIADAVKAALYRKNLPFKNDLSVKDLSQVRDFLQFLTLSVSYDTVRVRDVRELFSAYGTFGGKNGMGPKQDGYLLRKNVIKEGTRESYLRDLMGCIREKTFGEVLDGLNLGPRKTSIEILLKDMDLADKKVTSDLVDTLTYVVNNVDDLKHNEQIPDSEKKGVLIADCRNSMYVDRPFVIFIGMEDAWKTGTAGKEYIDQTDAETRDAERMSILLQQGESRVYAIRPASNGKPSIPCQTFGSIYEDEGRPRNIRTFEDICTTVKRGSWHNDIPTITPETGDTGGDLGGATGGKFSKTAYNSFCDCPLSYMFSLTNVGEDNEHMLFGNLLHSFAELYLCYPDAVKERGIDHYVDLMNEKFSGMSQDCLRMLDTSKFRVYLNNLVRYIDVIRPASVPLDTDMSDKKYPNELIADEGFLKCSSIAEAGLDSSLYPIFAKYDFVCGGSIVDYKTGSTKDVDGFGKNLDRTEQTAHRDFQSLIYLQVLSEHTDARPCTFDLFFMGDNDVESCNDDFNVMKNVRRIIVSDMNAMELVLSNECISGSRLTAAKTHTKLIGGRWDELRELLRDEDLDALDNDVDMVLNGLGIQSNKTNEKAMENLLHAVKKAASNNVFLRNSNLPFQTFIVPSNFMDKFLTDLGEDRKTADRIVGEHFYKTKPGVLKCDLCNYRNLCMADRSGTSDGGD